MAERSSGCGTFNVLVTALTKNEELLVQTLRALPPEAAEKVITWASQLSDLANDRRVDWSDAWSEEDLKDVTSASLGTFDEREAGER